ncbi:MAG TPA: DUF1830 domain-containing protein [Coleofasciculaceae cyanobacterium]|jgi:hypothetical protein
MSQILDPLPNNENNSILCCYVNATSRIQIARITNIANWYFERVVFPGQRLVFEANSSAILEIHCGMMASAILSDTIPCTKLKLHKNGEEQSLPKKQKVTNIEQARNTAVTNSLNSSEVSSSINLAV